jgi:hypothetical protein
MSKAEEIMIDVTEEEYPRLLWWGQDRDQVQT